MSLAAFSLPVKLSVFGDSHLKISFTVGPARFYDTGRLGRFLGRCVWVQVATCRPFLAQLRFDTGFTDIRLGKVGSNFARLSVKGDEPERDRSDMPVLF